MNEQPETTLARINKLLAVQHKDRHATCSTLLSLPVLLGKNGIFSQKLSAQVISDDVETTGAGTGLDGLDRC